MDQDATRYEVRLGPGDFVLDGNPAMALPKKEGTVLQFSAHVYCRQTARCIRILLSTEVGLSQGDIVLDGNPAPPKRDTHPNFRPMPIVAKLLDGSRCHLVRG